jgi:hypothetical protein
MKQLQKLLAILLVFLLTPAGLFAQKKLSDWGNVEKLKPSARIIVTTKKGLEFSGEKQHATPDTLLMEVSLPGQGTRTITLEKDDIAEVRQKKSGSWLPVIGGAIGVGAGIGFGSLADHPGTDDPHIGAMIGGLMGGLFGLAGGQIITKVASKAKTIYVAA